MSFPPPKTLPTLLFGGLLWMALGARCLGMESAETWHYVNRLSRSQFLPGKGTPAIREFRDEQGRVVRTIMYRSDVQHDPRDPVNPAELTAYSLDCRSYDARGNAFWQESYFPRESGGVWQRAQVRWEPPQTAAGDRVTCWLRGDLTRLTEYHESARGIAVVWFNEAGTKAIGAQGPFVPDLDWENGWGPARGGVQCQACFTPKSDAHSSNLITLQIHNGSEQAIQVPNLVPCDTVTLELRDGQGSLVAPDLARQREWVASMVKANGAKVLDPQTVAKGRVQGVGVAGINLDILYPNLPPGEYQVTVFCKLNPEDPPLATNPVKVTIPAK